MCGWSSSSNYLESSGGGTGAGTRASELGAGAESIKCPYRLVLGTLEEQELSHGVGVIPTKGLFR